MKPHGSGRVESGQELMLISRVRSGLVGSGRVWSDQVGSGRVGSGQVRSL